MNAGEQRAGVVRYWWSQSDDRDYVERQLARCVEFLGELRPLIASLAEK